MKLTKKKITEIIFNRSKIQRKLSSQLLNSFISNIKKNVRKKEVKISGFGTFYVHNSPKRIGRNPKTGESYIIRPMSKIHFKTSSKAKTNLN